MFLPTPVCFLCNESLQYRTPPTLPRSASSSSNRLLRGRVRCCVVSPFYKAIFLSGNYRPPLTFRSFTVLSQPHSAGCSHELLCWAVGHTAMKFSVPYLPTGCGAVRFSRSTVLLAVSSFVCLLFVSEIRSAFGLCFVPVCVHTVPPYSTSHSPQPVGRDTNYV